MEGRALHVVDGIATIGHRRRRMRLRHARVFHHTTIDADLQGSRKNRCARVWTKRRVFWLRSSEEPYSDYAATFEKGDKIDRHDGEERTGIFTRRDHRARQSNRRHPSSSLAGAIIEHSHNDRALQANGPRDSHETHLSMHPRSRTGIGGTVEDSALDNVAPSRLGGTTGILGEWVRKAKRIVTTARSPAAGAGSY